MNIKYKQVPSKIIVRRLPPTLPQSIFESSLPANVLNQTDYFEYFPGKIKDKGQVLYSRAYLNFISPLEAEKFKKMFHGHVYKDKMGLFSTLFEFERLGNEYMALVEYAPYQKIPKPWKEDIKMNTIETDSEYMAFVKELENPSEPTVVEMQTPLDPKMTPLLLALKDKKLLKATASSKKKKKKVLFEPTVTNQSQSKESPKTKKKAVKSSSTLTIQISKKSNS